MLGNWLHLGDAIGDAFYGDITGLDRPRRNLRTMARVLLTAVAGLALVFALALGAAGMLILALFVNQLTALLTFISLIGYAVIYTMFLKRNTPQNIVLGGAAGAAPPLLGWTAMTVQVESEALLLFLCGQGGWHRFLR